MVLKASKGALAMENYIWAGLVNGVFAMGYSLLIDQRVTFPNTTIRHICMLAAGVSFCLLTQFLLDYFNPPKK